MEAVKYAKPLKINRKENLKIISGTGSVVGPRM